MQLRFVGCGDAFGSGGRSNTCFHITGERVNFLIDCGASSLPALQRQAIARDAIDLVLITHFHGDHFGGLPFLLWGVFFRTVIGLHTTWLVNSATHSWGSRRFVTKDLSTNSWWVALLTFGEGWHNNHHAHPVSARHGLKWYEIDMNWYGIWALKKLGLARHVYRDGHFDWAVQEEEHPRQRGQTQ